MSLEATDILAGPILRRVERRLVSVWIALAVSAAVDIELFRGQGSSGGLGPAVPRRAPPSPFDTRTLAAGKGLHVVVSIWEPAALVGLDLGEIYSYDLVITPTDGSGAVRLKDLGLLADRPGPPRGLALGYQENWLPSFALPPENLSDLKVVQGSCRGSNELGRDAMPPIDDLIRSVVTDAKRRPHLLLLTGDQIYADESAAEQLEMLQAVSSTLLGTQETIPVDFKATADEPAATITYPLDTTHFPPGRRGHPLNDIAGFTSTSTDSHVMGFGEYAALYLSGWSTTTWRWNPGPILAARKEPFEIYVRACGRAHQRLKDYSASHPDADKSIIEEMIRYHAAWRLLPPQYRVIDAALTDADRAAAWGKGHKDDNGRFVEWEKFWVTSPDDPTVPTGFEEASDLPAGGNREKLNRLARALTPSWFAGVEYFGIDYQVTSDHVDPMTLKLITKKDEVHRKVSRVQWFHDEVPRVQRLMANVPCYMVFDDHEITDDWNITPAWAKHTRASALGRAVIRNGLAACTLFQSWGNDPLAYRDGTVGRMVLRQIEKLFATPTPTQPGPDPAAAAYLEWLFDLRPPDFQPPGSSSTAPPKPDERMRWDFRYDGPGFELIALDTRTWRGFEPQANEQIRSHFADDATATMLTDEAVRLQIPDQPAMGVNPDGICFVIAAAPFIGYPVVESVVQPLINLHDISKAGKPDPPFVRWQRTFSVGRVARDPENWGFVPSLFEAVLARLSTRRRVAFLSGDVHYGFTLKMGYWQLAPDGQVVDTTRVAQLTASSFRAQRGDLAPLVAIDLAQQLGGLSSFQERLGWRRGPIGSPEAGPPLVPGENVFSPHLQLVLGEDPIVVSPQGIPETTQVLRAPQWAWRAELAADTRPDDERLGDLHPPPFSKVSELEMIQSVAERHLWQSHNAMPRGWQWWTNFTLVEFTADAQGKPEVLRHLIYGFDPQSTGAAMRPYIVAEIPLAVTEAPPVWPPPSPPISPGDPQDPPQP